MTNKLINKNLNINKMRKLLTIILILTASSAYSQNFRTVKYNGATINIQVYISLSLITIDGKDYKINSNNWTINSLMDELVIGDIKYIYKKAENKHFLFIRNKIYNLYE